MAKRQYQDADYDGPGVISTHYGHLVGVQVPDWDNDEDDNGIPSSHNFGRANCKSLPSTYPTPRQGS